MNHSTIVRLRLVHQEISHPRSSSPGEIVAKLGAIQAQDYLGTLWAIGVRLLGATEAGVEQAIADREIVRTWPMRGTLHFVAAADVRWMLALLAPRVIARSAGRYRQLELDDEVFARSRELLAEALGGGKRLSRHALYEVLETGGVATAGQRGIHILGRLAQDGLLCFGPREGKQPTFVLLDEWVPASRSLQGDEALAELARRYFSGHGPATLQDFMWWTGMAASDARAGIEMARAHLHHEVFDGRSYWMSPEMPPVNVDTPSLHLLPGFDGYMLGYTDRSAVLDPADASKVHPGGSGVFSPVIVVNGRVAGTWKRAFNKGGVTLTPQPFATLGQAEMHAFAEAAQHYGQFLQMPVGAPAP